MNFYFDSFEEFIAMGGKHGPFVWSAYGVFFLVLVILAWNSATASSRFKKQQRALLMRQSELSKRDAEEDLPDASR